MAVLCYAKNSENLLSAIKQILADNTDVIFLNSKESRAKLQEIISKTSPEYVLTEDNLGSFKSGTESYYSSRSKITIISSGSENNYSLNTFNFQDLYKNAKAFCKELEISSQRFIITLPISSIGGFNSLLRGWAVNAEIVLKTSDYNKACLSLFPSQLRKLDRESPKELSAMSLADLVLVGGEVFDIQTKYIVEKYKLPVLITYGMTETAGTLAVKKPEDKTYKSLRGVKFRLQKNSQLEILAPLTKYKWITSSDFAELDVENNLISVSRVSRMLNRGGFKYSLDEIENKILTIPEVESVECKKQTDDIWGEKAVCSFKGKINKADLLSRLAQDIPAYKLPELI